ncbi:hypothetical protein P148_SR1C00001G0124 [candidate division SR1 bacterium RAAC1_SR1_1]|nr:hypothetical protein P148_SR1C00001G0124 [candidate division SR1 bacterium RAAC1_SR1_1]
MKVTFQKVKTEHHILPEFKKLLLTIEKHPHIHRIIPGRINRQQKGSSELLFKISYPTPSGIKCIMSKGSTAQELFVICGEENIPEISLFIQEQAAKYLALYR